MYCSIPAFWTHGDQELAIGETRLDADCRKTRVSLVEEEPLFLQESMQSHCCGAARFSSCQSTMLQRKVSLRFICGHSQWYGWKEESARQRKFGITSVLNEACKWRRRGRPPEFFLPSSMGMMSIKSAFFMPMQSLRSERSAREVSA
jgi:hypothetical protein